MARYDDADDEDRPRKSRRPRKDDDDDDRPRKSRRPREDDDDDDRPQVRRRPLDDADEDRPRRKKWKARAPVKQMSPVGIVALSIGVLALVASIFMPCIASWSLVASGIGLIVGFVGLILAQKSDGRQGIGMPLAGMSVSAVAVLIAVGWLVLGKKIEKRIDRIDKEFQAQEAKEQAAHQKELARAADDVKAAAQGGGIPVTAVQFAQAYDNDVDAADWTYKNKVLDVSGSIEEVQVDEQADTYTVVLKGGQFVSVDCEFAKTPENRARLARLKPGDRVTIRGKCLGTTATIEACVMVE